LARFGAVFNGQGHSITINSFADTTTEYLGLFGYTYGAGIENLNIVCNLGNAEFPAALGTGSAYSHVGALVGKADTTNIENITVSGSLYFSRGTGGYETYFGGIAGSYGNGMITSCRVNAVLSLETTAGTVYAGGAVGYDSGNSIIEKSSFTGKMYAEGVSVLEAGGMAGRFSGSVTSCYVSGTVHADSSYSASAGGIVGSGSGSADIEKCYAWADVRAGSTGPGDSYAGGIAGRLATYSTSSITQCYARGMVDANYAGSGGGYAGGIAGSNDGQSITYYAVLIDDIAGATAKHGVAGKDVGGTYSKNYGANELQNLPALLTPGSDTDQNGNITSIAYAGFQSSAAYNTPFLTTWNFTAGTGDWKWLSGSGYAYPVLQWQTSPPPDGPPMPS
jgi:hypothetical protein